MKFSNHGYKAETNKRTIFLEGTPNLDYHSNNATVPIGICKLFFVDWKGVYNIREAQMSFKYDTVLITIEHNIVMVDGVPVNYGNAYKIMDQYNIFIPRKDYLKTLKFIPSKEMTLCIPGSEDYIYLFHSDYHVLIGAMI